MAVQVEIRRMQREDIPRVMEIERECFTTPWHESAYLTEVSNRSAYYIVACIDRAIVGYAGMWLIMDEAHITTLGVATEYRRLRIGEQVLIALLDESLRRGIQRATLEVRWSNNAAQRLYQKYGFVPVAIRHGYYTDNNEDAVVMWVDELTSPLYQHRFNELKDRLQQETDCQTPTTPAEGLA